MADDDAKRAANARFERLSRLLDEALDLPESARGAFVHQSADDDPELLAAALAAPPAGSCGFHGQLADIAAAHPRSLNVAFAVRDAYDRGELAELRRSVPARPA